MPRRKVGNSAPVPTARQGNASPPPRSGGEGRAAAVRRLPELFAARVEKVVRVFVDVCVCVCVPSRSGCRGLALPVHSCEYPVLLPLSPPCAPPPCPEMLEGLMFLGWGCLSPFPSLHRPPPSIPDLDSPAVCEGSFLEKGWNARRSAPLAGPPPLLGGPGKS